MPEPSDLPPPRPVRVAVLPHPAHARAEALARGWLADTLGLAEARIDFERAPHGRPSLRIDGRAAAFDVNWSHSGGRLAIALGDGVRVGIDIERARPRPRALELARRYFTAAEAAALASLPAGAHEPAFLRLWCAKEAVLKAHGRGLAFGLDRLCFDRLHATPRLVHADAALGAVASWTLEALDMAPDGGAGMVAWQPR